MARGKGKIPPTVNPAEVEVLKERKDKYEKAIRQMEKHVSKHGGRLQLDVNDPGQVQADPCLFEALRLCLEETNKKLERGELKLDDVQLTLDAPSAGLKDALTVPGGINALRWQWWGFQLYIDDKTTQDMVSLIPVEAGGAALLAFVTGIFSPPGGMAIMLTAAIWFFGLTLIVAIDDLGGFNGVVIMQPWIGGPSLTSQSWV